MAVIDEALYEQVFQNAMRKGSGNRGCALDKSILKSLRVLDEQDHVNAGMFHNLPRGIDHSLIERITYYRGRGAAFYLESNDRFYFLPFTLRSDGPGLDVYGRYIGISPVPFNGTANYKGDEKPWIDGMILKPQYDIIMPEELTYADVTESAVILNDYTPQISQYVQPRSQLNEPLLQVMSECVPFMRTALLNNTGIDGIRITSGDGGASVIEASNNLTRAAIVGDRWIPITADLQAETFGHNAPGNVEEYLLAMQSMDNLRLSWHGLKNGGIFQKKSHLLEAEESMNQTVAGLVARDKIYQRQTFCTICNSIWGWGAWYEPTDETVQLVAEAEKREEEMIEE